MSMNTIFVLCPNGRRQPVKVSPNSSILEVLEEACQKQGFNANDYDISHYGKRLDLSLSVRYANLPNKAVLELDPVSKTRCDGTITVAVQLESGERLMDDFPPSTSIFDVVQTCLSNRGESIEKQSSLAEPVCVYMRQTLTGDEIQNTTLRSLGLTAGKAVIRLMYRPLEAMQEQAHISNPLPKIQPSEEEEEEVSGNLGRKTSSSSIMNDHLARKQPRLDVSRPSEFKTTDLPPFTAVQPNIEDSTTNLTHPRVVEEPSELMQLENNPSSIMQAGANNSILDATCNSETMESENITGTVKEIGEIKYLGLRNAVLFNLEDIAEVRREDFPPEFYELTVNDIVYLMEEYKKTRCDLENEPLMLKSQREARLFQQLACYKQTVIRIYFPEKLVLQGTFIAEETVQAVADFVRNFLEDEQLEFYLYITPPKVKLPADKTLVEARLVPAAVVYFGCDQQRPCYLHENFRSQISDPRAAGHVAMACRQKSVTVIPVSAPPPSEEMVIDGSEVEAVPPQPIDFQSRRPNHPEGSKNVPKWFKIGK